MTNHKPQCNCGAEREHTRGSRGIQHAMNCAAFPAPCVDDRGQSIRWAWNARERFLHARAELIHAELAEGASPEAIARSLSCDPGQVRLISMTDLKTIPGLPGMVWPPSSTKPAKHPKGQS